jgi:hypothetical protein
MTKHDPTTPSQAAAAPQRTRKVPKGQKKRSCDGQMKLGVWFIEHKFKKMFYMFSNKRDNDYDKELAHVMRMIEKVWHGKVQSAKIYHVGDSTSGPEILGWKNGNWYTPTQK